MSKKVLSLLLLVCLVLSITACSQLSTTTTTTQSTTKSTTSGTTASQTVATTTAEAPVKITSVMADWGNIKNTPDEKMVLDKIKNDINVDLQVIAVPVADYEQKVNLKFASGEDFDTYTESSKLIDRYRAGQIISISPFIDQYGPNFKDEARVPDDFRAYATVDDQLLGLSSGGPRGVRRVVSIREDWVNKLGLTLPKTIEELETYFSKVLTTDLNGNGKQDEIPLFSGGWNTGKITASWQQFFLVHGGNDWIDENGNYNINILDPNYKIMLQKLQDWYKAGYIWQECYTAQDTQTRELEAQNVFGAFAFWDSEAYSCAFNLRNNGVPEAKSTIIMPKGPGINLLLDGKRPFSVTCITSTCKNPEKAVALLNWALSDEGIRTLNYGIENVHWVWADSNKKSVYLLNVPDNDPGKAVYFNQFNQFGGELDAEVPYLNTAFNAMVQAYNKELSVLPKQGILGRFFTYDDSQWESKKTQNDRDTLINETETKILMNQASIDEWDVAIAKWREIGGDTFLKEKGQAYKEMHEKTGRS